MFCTACGAEVRETDRFCPNCGKATGRGGRAPNPNASPVLARRMDEKKIAGVCAGFAHYLGIDTTLVRLVWLTFALLTGVGFIAYLVAWIIMPKDGRPDAEPVLQRV